jgi:hypothetical protein
MGVTRNRSLVRTGKNLGLLNIFKDLRVKSTMKSRLIVAPGGTAHCREHGSLGRACFQHPAKHPPLYALKNTAVQI